MNKPRVLLVEEEVTVARDLECRLSRLGYEPVGNTGLPQEAVALANQFRPDLVLMGIPLPGSADGIAAASQIRQRWGIPLIFLTAPPGGPGVDRTKLAEPYGYLIRPFEDGELQVAIEMALHKAKADGALRACEERHRQLFECSLEAILFSAPDGRVFAANAAACRLLGMSEQEIIDRGRAGLVDPTDERLPRLLEERLTAGVVRGELRFLRKDGTPIEVAISSSLFTPADGATEAIIVLQDITERRQMEEELRRSERLFRLDFEEAPVGRCLVGLDGRFLKTNNAFRAMLRRSETDLQGLTFLEVTHPEDRAASQAAVQRLGAGEFSRIDLEKRYLTHDEQTVWGSVRVGLVRDEVGAPFHYSVHIQDITEQKRGEDRVRHQHELALAQAAAGSLEEGLRLCLEAALQSTGLDAGGFYLEDEISGALEFFVPRGLSPEFVHAVSRYEAVSDRARLVMAGLPVYARFEDLGLGLSEPERREGLRFVAVIPLSHEGKVVGCMNVASHTVEDLPPAIRRVLETIAATATQAIVRLRAEERLRRSEALLNHTQRLSKVGGWEWDVFRQTMIWSEETYRIHGMRSEEFAPGSDEHIRLSVGCYEAEYQTTILEAFRRCAERGEPYDLELPFTRRDGRSMWVRTTAEAIWEGTRVVKVRGNLMDITERKEAEAALHKLSQAVEQSPASVMITDLAGNIEYVNRRLCEITGYDPDEILGRNPRLLQSGRTPRETYRQLWAAVTSGQEWDGEMLNRKKSGELFWERALISPITDAEGRTTHFLGIKEDITESKQSEDALRASEASLREALGEVRRQRDNLRRLQSRLAEIQEKERRALARELHDQVGQALTGLGFNLNSLMASLPRPSAPVLRQTIEDSLRLLQETSRRVRDVMAELRPSVLDDYGLVPALKWYACLFQKRTGIQTEVKAPEALPRFAAESESHIFRIAQEAMTNVAKHSRASQVVLTFSHDSRILRLELADNGCGVAFGPGGPAADHIGYGLMTMRERAEALGGSFEFDSPAGGGVRVMVEVPLC